MNAGALFPSENPLRERVGEDFFRELPSTPGIYKMYGMNGRLLYVGKAKNLRKRLMTYPRVRAERDSRKTVRLVRLVHAIEIEVHPTEKEALLRENILIRDHKPEFNHAKKQPETYYYLVLHKGEKELVTDLRMHMRVEEEHRTYGAFKGHITVRRGLGALLRQLYVVENDIRRPFDLPSQLLKKLTPLHYRLKAGRLLESDWWDDTNAFLEGSSDRLMYRLVEHCREEELMAEFLGKLILKDMEALTYFYKRCTNRNFEMKNLLGLDSSIIPQEELDDYLVRLAFKKMEGGHRLDNR